MTPRGAWTPRDRAAVSAPRDDFRMPAPAPLAMPVQSFHSHPTPRQPFSKRSGSLRVRIAAFAPAIAVAMAFVLWIAWGTARGDTGPAMVALLAIIGASFAWATLSVSAVTIALWHRARHPSRGAPTPRGGHLDVALLVPIRNETPVDVMGNIAAMRADLAHHPEPGRYAFFVLSDTQDTAIAEEEARLVAHLWADTATGVPVYYRRRRANTDRKTGNLRDWITRWGDAWEAMIVLDADSLMSADAIARLSDAMARDPDAGLIQSYPGLIAAETLFGRMQTFASGIYGGLAAEGHASWTRSESNYWGHNAIIRTRAFAECAGLPHLGGRIGRRQLILSHDFVEAALLRRAGWSVRFLPESTESYEEPPATLIDYLLRDRRWCRGNMQHLRLLTARGFHPLSRFHLAQGAAAYLLSPVWFAFLILWATLLSVPAPTASAAFGSTAPVQPGGTFEDWWLLLGLFAMLLYPKLAAAGLMLRDRGFRQDYGSGWAFVAAIAVEILLSAVYAPILMVQQARAVARALLGRPEGWAPQRRSAVRYGWSTLLRFHGLEAMLGIGLAIGIVSGSLSPWLSPVTFSLLAAPGLSWLSGLPVSGRRIGSLRLDSLTDLKEPAVLRAARAERARLRRLSAEDPPPFLAVAAE